MDLCPSCGMREIDDLVEGFCSRCVDERNAFNYGSRKRMERLQRWLQWTERRRSA